MASAASEGGAAGISSSEDAPRVSVPGGLVLVASSTALKPSSLTPPRTARLRPSITATATPDSARGTEKEDEEEEEAAAAAAVVEVEAGARAARLSQPKVPQAPTALAAAAPGGAREGSTGRSDDGRGPTLRAVRAGGADPMGVPSRNSSGRQALPVSGRVSQKRGEGGRERASERAS